MLNIFPLYAVVFTFICFAITPVRAESEQQGLLTPKIFTALSRDVFDDFIKENRGSYFKCKAVETSFEAILEKELQAYHVLGSEADIFKRITLKRVKYYCGLVEKRDDPRGIDEQSILKASLWDANEKAKGQIDPLSPWAGQAFTTESSARYDFDIGYEFNSIDNIFKTGVPRVGIKLYRQYNDSFHMETQFGLVSPGEEVAVNQDIYSLNSLGKTKVLSLSMAPAYLFWETGPVMVGNQFFESRAGPIAKVSLSAEDINKQFSAKYYAGIRTALGPRIYTNILFGRTEGLASIRMEIQGEMPLYRKDDGNTFYLGYSLNMGIKNKVALEKDVFKAYVVWEVSDAYQMLMGE